MHTSWSACSLIPVVVLARWQQIVDCAALEHRAWLEAQEVWVRWVSIHLQIFHEPISQPVSLAETTKARRAGQRTS